MVEGTISCSKLLGLLALVTYLLGVVVATLKSNVFPAGSHLQVDDGSYPRPVPLARTGILKAKLGMMGQALFRPFGRPRQRLNTPEGLAFEAVSGGTDLICGRGGWPNYYLERYGEKLADIKAQDGGHARITLIWDDELREAIPRGRVIKVKCRYE